MKPFLFLSLLFAASARATTVSLNPVEDTFVSSAHPASSYGAAGQLSVAAGALSKGEFDSLMKFDLSSAKTTFDSTYGVGLWTVQSIKLTLTNTAPNNAFFNGNGAGPGGTNVNFSGLFTLKWMQNDGWIQGSGTPAAAGSDGITFSTLPGFLSVGDESVGSYSYAASTTGNSTWTLSLTSGFTADATAGNLVSLLALPGDNGVSFGVNSEDFGTVGNRPILAITAVASPEPSVCALLTFAAIGGFARRRRDAFFA